MTLIFMMDALSLSERRVYFAVLDAKKERPSHQIKSELLHSEAVRKSALSFCYIFAAASLKKLFKGSIKCFSSN